MSLSPVGHTLLDLPAEALAHTVSFLKLSDYQNCALTSKVFCQFILTEANRNALSSLRFIDAIVTSLDPELRKEQIKKLEAIRATVSIDLNVRLSLVPLAQLITFAKWNIACESKSLNEREFEALKKISPPIFHEKIWILARAERIQIPENEPGRVSALVAKCKGYAQSEEFGLATGTASKLGKYDRRNRLLASDEICRCLELAGKSERVQEVRDLLLSEVKGGGNSFFPNHSFFEERNILHPSVHPSYLNSLILVKKDPENSVTQIIFQVAAIISSWIKR